MTFPELEAEGIQLHALVAMASNRVIGRAGGLPWHLPEDLKLFKRRTLNHPIIMGRVTFESLPHKRPLPRRRNIVLSRSGQAREDVETIQDLSELKSLGIRGDAYLIGGARVFADFLGACSSVILTYIHAPHAGDTLMPPFEADFPHYEILESTADFEVRHHRRQRIAPR